jgi:hypothetical protein
MNDYKVVDGIHKGKTVKLIDEHYLPKLALVRLPGGAGSTTILKKNLRAVIRLRSAM